MLHQCSKLLDIYNDDRMQGTGLCRWWWKVSSAERLPGIGNPITERSTYTQIAPQNPRAITKYGFLQVNLRAPPGSQNQRHQRQNSLKNHAQNDNTHKHDMNNIQKPAKISSIPVCAHAVHRPVLMIYKKKIGRREAAVLRQVRHRLQRCASKEMSVCTLDPLFMIQDRQRIGELYGQGYWYNREMTLASGCQKN